MMGDEPAADSGAPRRLYGMMQFLMMHYAEATPPASAEPRGVVELPDALEAVLQVAAVVDEYTQAGAIPAGRGVHAVAMLMVLRDYIQPLPPAGEDGAAVDPCTRDLREMVEALRAVRAPDTLPPDFS